MIDYETTAFIFELLKRQGISFGVHSFDLVGFRKITTEEAFEMMVKGYQEDLLFLKEKSDWDEVLSTALERILLCNGDQSQARNDAKDILSKYGYYSFRMG